MINYQIIIRYQIVIRQRVHTSEQSPMLDFTYEVFILHLKNNANIVIFVRYIIKFWLISNMLSGVRVRVKLITPDTTTRRRL